MNAGNHFGPGQELAIKQPSPNGVDLLYSDEYVARRMAQSNLYDYCGNNPVNRVDPSGLVWITLGDLEREGERRRGSQGPNDDSSHHCWVACEWAVEFSSSAGLIPLTGVISGFSFDALKAAVTAFAMGCTEERPWSLDAQKDIKANNKGALCAQIIGGITSRWFYDCDDCCGTKPK